MRTLIVSGSVPGTGHVGEIILRDLVLHLNPARVAVAAVTSPAYRWQPDASLAVTRTRVLHSDFVSARRRGTRRWSAPWSHLRFRAGFHREAARLAAAIVASARGQGIEQVFGVLNNALIYVVARQVARELSVPLKTLVWDPPEYMLRQSRFDRWTRASLTGEFRKSLAASARVAVVSETMREDYARWTRAPIQLLRHGVEPLADEDGMAALPQDEWVIGFAGSMYSSCAWRALLKALDHADWQIAGRPVRLRLLTGKIEVSSRRRARIDYLGFRPPTEAQQILQGCHLTYMPQPFVPHLHSLCRYAFPTKLGNYLALGRPVFVHAPADGALSAFYACNPVGAHADSLESHAIQGALEGLLGDPAAYARAASRAREVAATQFTAASFHNSVDELLGSAA